MIKVLKVVGTIMLVPLAFPFVVGVCAYLGYLLVFHTGKLILLILEGLQTKEGREVLKQYI